ncbi:MAG: YbhB/YbcL family Raf kinase inhibitor-like protein [Planctomycetota bacterium]
MRRWWKWILAVAVLIVAVVLWRCQRGGHAPARPEEGPQLTLTCPIFSEGEIIPARYTAEGRNISPPLLWHDAPEGTRTFAIIMQDPDAPVGTFTHWSICEISGSRRGLSEGVPPEENVLGSAVQGLNGFREVGYGGPAPPAGEEHRYYFRLYALDEKLDMPGGFSKNQLQAAMRGHVLAQAELMGRYGRPE